MAISKKTIHFKQIIIIKACLVTSSQILLTEEFVEKMLEDLEDLTSPEEVSCLVLSESKVPVSRSLCVRACVSVSDVWREAGKETLEMLNGFISLP